MAKQSLDKVFQSKGTPPVTWEQILSWCDSAEGTDLPTREAAHKAIEELRSLLGAELIEPDQNDLLHPIVHLFGNTATWTRHRLIWLASVLRLFQAAEGFDSVVKKLKNQHLYSEGTYALDIAECLCNCGAISFEKDTDTSSSKQADLKLLTEEGTIHVELQTLNESNDEVKASAGMEEVFHALHSAQLGAGCWAGRMLRIPSEFRLMELLQEIHTATAQARELGFATLEIPTVIEAGMCVPDSIGLLEAWAISRQLKPGMLDGPPTHDDDLRRAKARIHEKVRQGQIPRDEPGIIVVRSSALMGYDANPEVLAMSIEDEIHIYPNILAVVVIGSYWGKATGIRSQISDSVFASAQRFMNESRQTIFLLNRFSKTLLPENLLCKIRRCFTGE